MHVPVKNISFSGPLWHVVYVEPRMEGRVETDIGDVLGYRVFAPVEKYRKVHRGRRVDAARPYFPRYLFVEVDPYRQTWQSMLDIDGVIDVLGRPACDADGYPSYVPTAWVEAMRRAEEAGIFDRIRVKPDKFKVGETVRITEGPFAGFNAIIEEFVAKLRSAKSDKRAKVLVAFMGRMSSIDVDILSIDKV